MAAVPAVLTAAVVLSYSTVLLQVPPAVIPAAAVLAGRLADSAAALLVGAAPPAVGDLRVFSVYIPFLISRVRPVHSFFENESILENPSQICKFDSSL